MSVTKTIRLGPHEIAIELGDGGGGSITSSLPRLECDHCGKPDCCYQCDESTAHYVPADPAHPKCRQVIQPGDSEDEVAARLQFNGAMDAIESFSLAFAVAGGDVETPAFAEAIQSLI